MNAPTTDCDVLVVGGGMVGASLALALAPQGLRVVLVEAQAAPVFREPGYDDRATALSAGSRRHLDTLGLWTTLAPHMAAIQRVHVSEQGRFGVAWLDARELRLEALGWVTENLRLVTAFQDALTACHGLEVLQPARVTDIQPDADGVTVGLDEDGATRVLRTRLLVGADGARSRVREAIGVTASTRDYGQTAIVANLTSARPHEGVAWERFTRHGPLAFLPLTQDRCAIVWSQPTAAAEAALALPDTTFCAHVNRLFGERLGPIERLGRRQSWPLVRTLAATQRVGRTVLVGNAAHSLHPIAGQGFNLSLRDCMALAQAVARGLEFAGDPGHDATLAAWQAARRADQARVGDFTEGLNRLFLVDLPGVGALRSLGLGVFGLSGPARRLVARYGAGVQ